MKKGDIFEGTVERLDFPNKGTLNIDGEQVMVKNVLPGQKIRAAAGKRRKGKTEGRLLQVIEKAPAETEKNPCAHFGICGGCSYQTIPYEKQLEIKSDMVMRLIHESCPEEVFEGIKGSPKRDSYRNKMEYSFGDEVKDGPLTLGMHKRGSFHDIVTVGDCRIADEDFRRILLGTLSLCTEEGLPFYKKMKHEGYLRHLLVRKAWKTGEILVALVTSGQLETAFAKSMQEESKTENKAVEKGPAKEVSDREQEKEREFLQKFSEMLKGLPLKGRLVGILHMRNNSQADVVKSDRTLVLYGQDYFYEEILGLRFKITPFSFFQTNSAGAEVLYSTAREFIGDTKDKLVYDLYSGTGTIAQVLAPVAKRVIGVEIVEEAVEAARENAALNGLDNCEFLAGDVLKVLDTIEEKPDLIVLDPPRDGIHPKALPKIIAYGVDRIVYISCKPTSLARDLKVLTAAGYQVERACAVDMFPGTANVETCVLLSKIKSTPHIEVEINLDEMDLTKAESKATYEEIKEYVLKNYGMNVTNLYIAQVKRKYGIIERINYNLGEGKARVPQVTPEKETAIEDALRHFQMIS